MIPKRAKALNHLFIIVGMVLSSVPANAANTLTICSDHFPPYFVYEKSFQRPYGILIDLLATIAGEMQLKLEHTPEQPLKRCLNSLLHGHADVTAGLLDKDNRKDYLILLPYWEKYTSAFYVLKDSTHRDIKHWDDLTGLNIAVADGFHYFPKFDQESRAFNKQRSHSFEHSIKLLLARQVDAFVGTKLQVNFLISQYPSYDKQIIKVPYEMSRKSLVHIGLSKKSIHAHRAEEMQRIIDGLREQGDINRIMNNLPKPDDQMNTGKK